VRIKAWVPGAENARRTLTILYRIRRGLLTIDDHEELYWNVTGDEWDVPIRETEAVVALPPGLAVDTVRTIAYTGPRGAAGTDYAERRADQLVTFRTTRPLRPREGLTVAVAWPLGLVGRPSVVREAWWFLEDNWPLGLPLLTLALVLVSWRAYGRDPDSHRSVKPEYAPPPDLVPAEAGTLVDERAEPRDVVATIVDLAVRGHLRIEQVPRIDQVESDDPDFLVRRLTPAAGDAGLKPFERFVLSRLFAGGAGVDSRLLSEIRRDYDSIFPPMRDQIYGAMVQDKLFPASPERTRALWAALGATVLAAAAFVWVMEPPWASPELLAIGIAASGLVVLGFARIMPRRTWRGVQALVRVRGFQEFLERAEKDRLARLPPDTLHRWLPWAIALGVTERWIRGFEGLPVEEPTWIRMGDRFTLSGYDSWVTRLGSRMEQAILTGRRSSTGGGGSSSSSGFSGGSSGGGLGGGGGGTF
jgi:uncharacterized membrane protein YgcG